MTEYGGMPEGNPGDFGARHSIQRSGINFQKKMLTSFLFCHLIDLITSAPKFNTRDTMTRMPLVMARNHEAITTLLLLF